VCGSRVGGGWRTGFEGCGFVTCAITVYPLNEKPNRIPYIILAVFIVLFFKELEK
jgi:hypothetical protein